ncbi:MAG: PAS domain S-box protein [Chloroflexota bacterium]
MKPTRILVVEDENVIALDLQRRLGALGYDVPAVAATGERAMAVAADLEPDLLLMDIKLQGNLDGVETARLIRAQHDVPIIYMTSYTDEETIRRASGTHPYGYLVKPYSDRELRSSVEIALHKHEAEIAQRSQAEEAVRASKEHYINLVDNARDAIFILEPDGTISFLNPAFETLTGWAGTEWVGRAFLDLLDADSVSVARAMLRRAQNGEKPPLFEVSLAKESGGLIVTEVLWVPVMRDEEVTSILGIGRDVTNRKQIEEERHRQRHALHLIISSMPTLLLTVDKANHVTAFYAPPHLSRLFNLSDAVVNRHLGEVLPGKLAETVIAVAEKTRQSGDIIEIEHSLTESDEHNFLSVKVSPILGSDETLVVLDDITKLKRAEEAEREQRTLAEALRAVAAVINSTLNLNEVLDRVLDTITQVAPHDGAVIMLIESGVARVAGYRGDVGMVLSGAMDKLKLNVAETPPLAHMIETGEPLSVPDIKLLPPSFPAPKSVWIRSMIMAPIFGAKECLGFVALVSATTGHFDAPATERLVAFADQAAIAIQNAKLYRQAQELAAMEERGRLARDLHDAVSQTLFSASVIAEMLPRLWKSKPDSIPQRLTQLHRLIRGAMAEMRTLLIELRPTALVETELNVLLSHLADAVAGRTSTNVVLKVDGSDSLPSEVRIAFYRIAQEALNNVIKHERANEVHVCLRCTSKETVLQVEDDGRGFDQNAIQSDNLGLNIMRERAAEIGAKLTIDSVPEKGTRVVVRWSHATEGEVHD